MCLPYQSFYVTYLLPLCGQDICWYCLKLSMADGHTRCAVVSDTKTDLLSIFKILQVARHCVSSTFHRSPVGLNTGHFQAGLTPWTPFCVLQTICEPFLKCSNVHYPEICAAIAFLLIGPYGLAFLTHTHCWVLGTHDPVASSPAVPT